MKIITNLKNSFSKKKKKTSPSSSRSGNQNVSSSSSEGSVKNPLTPPKISRRELEVLLRKLPDPLTEEEMVDMLAEADRVGDGSIAWEDIQALGTGTDAGFGSDPMELRETFKVFDADGDGKISAEELLGIFATLGDADCSLEDCKGMIRVVDSDADGFVCFDDFVGMMKIGVIRCNYN